MKRLLVSVTAAFLFTFGSIAPVATDPGNGANQSGEFDSTPSSGDNQGNGNAPANGSVGNADDKNPPGQSNNDKNHGYECDNNKGTGNDGGNPAHTGCTVVDNPTPTTVPASVTLVDDPAPTTVPPSVTMVDDPAPTTVPAVTPPSERNSVTMIASGVTIEREAVVNGVTAEREAVVESLAVTGFTTDVLLPLGLLLLALGVAMVKLGSPSKRFRW